VVNIRLWLRAGIIPEPFFTMSKKKKVKRYTDEEKKEILAYAEEHSQAAAAKKFGASPMTISKWKKGPVTKKNAKKKTTTKKTVAKKQAEDKTKDRIAAIAAPDLGFDILDSDSDVFENAAQVLSSVVSRRKNQTIGFATASDIKRNVLWIPEFEMQHAMGVVGLPHGSFLEIIAPESAGKTSLALTIAGWAMDQGAPAVYCECEGKQMPPHRMIRMMSSDPKKAGKMLSKLRVERIGSLDHLDQFLMDYADVMRGRKALKDYPISVPHHVPLVVIVDPWSRLMNQAEAAQFYDYGKNMDKDKKFQQTNTGTNFGHAKFAQAWCRRLAYMMENDNMILILCQHQSEDLKKAMEHSFGPKIILPEAITCLENKTHIGGRAPQQLATQQWILGQRSLAKYKDKTNSGKNINMAIAKNSFGPEKRKLFFEIRNEHRGDVPGVYVEPGLHFAKSFSDWFCKSKYLGSKIETSDGTYTCKDLGVHAVPAEEFHKAFHQNDEMKTLIGQKLDIEGYVDTVERIKEDIETREKAQEAQAEMPTQGDAGPPRPDFENVEEETVLAD